MSVPLIIPFYAESVLLVQNKLVAPWTFLQDSLALNKYQKDKISLSTSKVSDISLPTTVSINKEPLVQCKTFKYLGSTVANNARLDKELSLIVGHASA